MTSGNALRARLYAAAADACRPLDFPKPATIDAAEELVRLFEAEQGVRLAELVSKLRASARQCDRSRPERSPPRVATSPAVETSSRRYRKAAEAFGEHFPFSDQKVRRLCRANAVGAPSGHRFAQQIEGTWHVIDAEFSAWVERFKRGEHVD
jgi:hypothetical protein